MEDSIARKLRPQVLLAQADVARRIRTGLGLLKVESKMLRPRLAGLAAEAGDPARARFAASWQAIAERVASERRQCPSLKEGNAAEWAEEGLRLLLADIQWVRAAILSGQEEAQIRERLDAVDRRNRELSLSLDQLCRALGEEVDRLVAAYRDEP